MSAKHGGRLVELYPEVVKAFDEYLTQVKRRSQISQKLINVIL
jgi:hypothetical protein